MRFINPTRRRRLNEAVGLVYLVLGLCLALSLFSYHPTDPSWNAVRGQVKVQNLIGPVGSYLADLLWQLFGLAAVYLPLGLLALSFRWFASWPFESTLVKVTGAAMLLLGTSTAFGLLGEPRLFASRIGAGGVFGVLLADALEAGFNRTGAFLLTAATLILSLYLVSTFAMATLGDWFRGPIRWLGQMRGRWSAWRQARAEARASLNRARAKAARTTRSEPDAGPPVVDPLRASAERPTLRRRQAQPPPAHALPPLTEIEDAEIPIRTLEDETPPWLGAEPRLPDDGEPDAELAPAAEDEAEDTQPTHSSAQPPPARRVYSFRLPPTDLLNEPPARNPFDEQELKDIAARIKSKCEEFNVLGSVVQINPGPVVTTFEFKPEAGIKYSRITVLNDDLCLGLQAESILIERIPGKPTVGVEVPNSRREVISLRQIFESDEFQDSHSQLTMSLGKDISGRIKVAALESMPHLLIAGSTGSGKSVMLNTMIMSVLYKSTPNDVRMIMVDPKRVELGMYEGIPHLLTPVITDAKKATNALRNAVLEMERRLKLLASLGVRNIDQYNKKVRLTLDQPRSLFEDGTQSPEDDELRPLPYVLIVIDELADLMMIERTNVEESVTRLAQMARAVGMHLVLATQRPSVDVITGLIKANFPARISFRVATRVDSRTILDVMGAEHLLGKGDMLFLPPGSSRLTRVHGAFITEAEITRVVDFWKQQARPEYDPTFLLPPPCDDDEGEPAEFEGGQDPMYQDAVRVVLEMGKGSTSILQRRLRLGYGRAARILDLMQREGIIGPPDGSRPREVLKRPDWLEEVEVHPR